MDDFNKQNKKNKELFEKIILPLDYKDLNSVFAVTSGLMLSQVIEISSLESSIIHNWINRGFISRPVNKKYNINQVARVLIIDMLRSTMNLDDITMLLAIINGDVEDTSDDIISDSKLYEYIYTMIEKIKHMQTISVHYMEQIISEIIEDFEESIKGSLKILQNALEVIFYAYLSVLSKTEAETKLGYMQKNTEP